MNGLPRLGIDFGTSHTVAVCQWRDGGGQPLLFDASPLLPSAVLVDSQRRLLVGRDAQRGARADPAGFEPYPKRRVDEGTILLGGAEIGVPDVIAAVLHRCAGEAARVAGRPVAEVVLTHPAAWGPRRRAVLTGAAARAGIDAPVLIPEPVAAAVYFTTVHGVRVPPGAAVVVYDLGAGTFDVAVVRREGETGWSVLACDGFDDLGGAEFDELIVDRLRDRFRDQDPETWRRLTDPTTATDLRERTTLWDEARAAKEQLSRNSAAGVHVPFYGVEVVTREEFELAARPLIERTVNLTVSTLERAGVSPGAAAGLFLVGGSTRMPQVATQLHRRLGIAPTVIEQPELVVAQGAVTAAAAAFVPPPPIQPHAAPPQVSNPPERPAPPRKRRRRLAVAIAAAGTALVLAGGAAVYFLTDRESFPLNAIGQTNHGVFESAELAAFARPWLNEVTNCNRMGPGIYGGTVTEYVQCTGSDGSWNVQFRALTDISQRDASRQHRKVGYQGRPQSYTGERPESGQRIDYMYEQQYPVIYWDDDTSAMVGDLQGDLGATTEELAPIWAARVT
ncbi:hypothetical protein GCM10022251_29990 [Phytohabitans flavus]|uniref:Molecular chaperone DnaK n=1 Tax=Phytohabitans flavus TaxID=1076124 RepID=A0A6F8XXG1_9ACTN|nr:Hsp70 family protein [Phytohabitans flavus]BCB78421.1 hypothetical protein Pflav_048310 [Phytohabitans flavus]